MTRKIAILGSTGSIGTQTLDIIREYPERFHAAALTAGSNWELLARQALEFRPSVVVIADEKHLPALRNALAGTGIKVLGGSRTISDVAADPESDTVVGAIVGYSGLEPTLAAVKQGKRIALANKETLVAGGSLVTEACRRYGAELIPVDSEHSALFQCLRGEDPGAVRNLILTASGGPFRTLDISELEHVTPIMALKHPNWDMGAKVTVDSASMMNKGLEMIEARWLFDCPPEKIKIMVHPQSVVHSMVEYRDGSVKAQLGAPDMRMPIRYALGYPERLETETARLDVSQYASLTFEMPDYNKFPMLGIAYDAIAEGGNIPCAMNAANETAVGTFLDGKCRFTDMSRAVRRVSERVRKSDFDPSPDLEAIAATHSLASEFAREELEKLQ